jgi:hypothetical protein
MRARIKITDLSPEQWEHLTTRVPVGEREFLPGMPRACVEFELTPDLNTLHIEMDTVELAGLMTVLGSMDLKAAARAVFGLDELPAKLEETRNRAGSARLPVLPTADQVRNLSAEEAAQLTAQMNTIVDQS